jgi:ubiquinone/menaquinone biosynthesis C-methylase UbiE
MEPFISAFRIVLYVFAALVAWILVTKLIRRFWKFPTPAVLTTLIDNPFRRRVQSPEKLIKILSLTPDMFVLEVGPGKGTYTLEIAKKVPNGRLVAIDIQEAVIKRLKQKCEKLGITNVEPKVADVYSLDLQNETFDRIFLIFCLPEIPDPVRALRELHRVLKPKGRLCSVEAFMDPDYPLQRTEIRWASDAGFKLESKHGNWFIYYLLFSKAG